MKLHLSRHRGSSRRPIAHALGQRPTLELLEGRTLLSTFTVRNVNDSGPDSLQAAILGANSNAGADVIRFDIPGGGVKTIHTYYDLPTIIDSVLIDGKSQPGYASAPLIELSNVFGSAAHGLTIQAPNVTVRGLAIYGGYEAGIYASDGRTTGLRVESCSIGTDGARAGGLGNVFGIDLLAGASGNTIGTDGDGVNDASEGNLILNNASGVVLSEGANNNRVAGNIIQGSTVYGVHSGRSSGSLIGTDGNNVSDALERNIISSGATAPGIGVFLEGDTNTRVAGNYIGTDASGVVALANSDGVVAYGSSGIIVGTNGDGVGDLAERNVISGNLANGVRILSSGNRVAGNYIGTDAAGTAALRNAQHGILLEAGSDGNVIGTNGDGVGDVAERNVISGNRFDGVRILSSGNRVAGNYIGTTAAGTGALGNASGVTIVGHQNLIGGPLKVQRNVISANRGYGISLVNDASGNRVQNNYIGTTHLGTAALGNGLVGVAMFRGANHNIIGGTGAGLRNVISANQAHGVLITVNDSLPYEPPSYNQIVGNYIGTNAAGTAALGNAQDGVRVVGSTAHNTIGGAVRHSGNVISGNGADGVTLDGAIETVVAGNKIGTNAGGTAALGNALDGLDIQAGARDNLIGGMVAVAANVVSGNAGVGIRVRGAGTDHNVISANKIGTNAAGTASLGNGGHGIEVHEGARYNLIGGAVVGTRNVIAGNASYGVYLHDAGTDDNDIAGNRIGTNVTGSAALPNFSGIVIEGASRNAIGTRSDGVDDANTERNLISGNTFDAIILNVAPGTTVAGNYLGTNARGTLALPNGRNGVTLIDSAGVRIGTDADGYNDTLEGNLISANLGFGISLIGTGTSGGVIAGNRIGTNAAGTGALGNAADGVSFEGGAHHNTVGGTLPTARNRIAFNTGSGVALRPDAGLGNAILGNAIFSNGLLGIDLNNDGVTANDDGDFDAGPNQLQNSPVLGNVVVSGTKWLLTGTINSTANTTFRLEFFANAAADPSGYGEGEVFLGFVVITTDALGNASFSFLYAPIAGKAVISATATGPGGDTSEFSRALQNGMS